MIFAIVDDFNKEVINIVKAERLLDVATEFRVVEVEPWMSKGVGFDIVSGVLTPLVAEKTNTEKLAEYKGSRDVALDSIVIDVDGIGIQVRPSDVSNLQLGIVTGVTEWVSVNDTVVTVTTAQLQEVFDKGVENATSIWTDYKSKLKALGANNNSQVEVL